MEEDKYRATYDELTQIPCVFEKALTNNRARCSQSSHFWLADREGYSCRCKDCSVQCKELLHTLRQKSSFVLKLRQVDGPLPHNMDIRVQAGGLIGLARQFGEQAIDDIQGLVRRSIERFGSIESLPFGDIIQSVEQFEGRRRRGR